jgi:hypothetical protein
MNHGQYMTDGHFRISYRTIFLLSRGNRDYWKNISVFATHKKEQYDDGDP